MMIVCKFGGTSLGDAASIRRAVAIVDERRAERPVVVVSAMAGVTTTLLSAITHRDAGDFQRVRRILTELEARHQDTATALGLHPTARTQLGHELGALRPLLLGARDAPLVAAARERIAGAGEYLSSILATGALALAGLDTARVDARRMIITTSTRGTPAPRLRQIRVLAAHRLGPLLEQERVPVTQGFVGATAAGRPTTLGRGGSDLTATLLGGALDAERVEIWTDVAGVFTADPRVVPAARPIEALTPADATRLARAGAKVLHPETLAPLVGRDIPVIVKSTLAPHGAGTVIRPSDPEPAQRLRAVVMQSAADPVADPDVVVTLVGFDRVTAPEAERLFAELRDLNIEVPFGSRPGACVALRVRADAAAEVTRRLHRAFIEPEDAPCRSSRTSSPTSTLSRSACTIAS